MASAVGAAPAPTEATAAAGAELFSALVHKALASFDGITD